jgi:hypothetical protein
MGFGGCPERLRHQMPFSGSREFVGCFGLTELRDIGADPAPQENRPAISGVELQTREL